MLAVHSGQRTTSAITDHTCTGGAEISTAMLKFLRLILGFDCVAQLRTPTAEHAVARRSDNGTKEVVARSALDWNFPKCITRRYTAAAMEQAVAPLRRRIAEPEAQLKDQNKI